MPAPVSSTMRSKRGATFATMSSSCTRTSCVRREYSTRPEPASSTVNPPGAGSIASSSVQRQVGLEVEDDVEVREPEVGIEDQHALAARGERRREVRGEKCLADAALAA